MKMRGLGKENPEPAHLIRPRDQSSNEWAISAGVVAMPV
jgi:hypothetical protein